MRTTCTALVVLALLAAVSAQQVITDFSEFQRKKAEYDMQKAKYDEFQSLRNVPVLASYDLIPKVKDSLAPAGNAEQLLPNYTGNPVNFHEVNATLPGVEPGNTAQNYFHTGPIPAKKSVSEPPPKPVAIPTGPGEDFIVPQNDDSAAPVAAAPAPAADAGFSSSFATAAPAAADEAFTSSFSSAGTVAPTPTPAPAPFAAAPAAPAASGQALFFGRGALAVTNSFAPAAAPIRSASSFAFAPAFAPAPAFAAPATRDIPLRPLGREFQLGPALPHSDFHPGPIRAVPIVPQNVRQGVIPEAPVPLIARETFFAHDFPAAAAASTRSFGGVPAATYGPPGA